MRILVIGASSAAICGVRSYAGRLTLALESEVGPIRTCWWEQPPVSNAADLRRGWAAFSAGVRRLGGDEPPHWVLLHYSVFVWGSHGVPHIVPRLRSLLADLDAPVAVILHEYALPVRRSAPKQSLVALSQQAALTCLLPQCDVVIVTTPQRLAVLQADWRARRLRLVFLPVLSPLPVSSAASAAQGDEVADESAGADGDDPMPIVGGSARRAQPPVRVGVLGFGTHGYPAGVVTGAVGRLLAAGHNVELVLVGWPGAESPEGSRWRSAAEDAGCASVTGFTGILDEMALSRALAGLDLLVFPDPGGPAARKTTLAAAMAHGLPVVAFDGPDRWDPLVACGAVALAEPDAAALAAVCGPLIADGRLRRDQGTRARGFYESNLTPPVLARQLLAVLAAPAAGAGGSQADLAGSL